MKRLFSRMTAPVLLIAVAQAESFFPATPTTEYAPGYGAFANVAPNSEDT